MDIQLLSAALSLSALLAGCSDKSMDVSVRNHSGSPRKEIVEIPLADINSRLGEAQGFTVTCGSDTLPSQITSDNTLIFLADLPAEGEATYLISPDSSDSSYIPTTLGREYPERNDDLAWENDLIAYRAYGPTTQRNGEKGYGYDIFFKYPDKGTVLERLYASQTSQRNWQIADSLQKVDPDAAKTWRDSITYHIDHGYGMDCYAVGQTLGAGVAAIAEGDSIYFPWCYDKAEILDNGPLRFKARLAFAPVAKGSSPAVTEYREITLDEGSRLNHGRVWYEGLSDTATVVAGMPRRDDTEAILDSSDSFVAYGDPTTGPDNGRALLGVLSSPAQIMKPVEKYGHLLLEGRLAPTDTLDYYFGYAWSRTGMENLGEWADYLKVYSDNLENPLEVTY